MTESALSQQQAQRRMYSCNIHWQDVTWEHDFMNHTCIWMIHTEQFYGSCRIFWGQHLHSKPLTSRVLLNWRFSTNWLLITWSWRWRRWQHTRSFSTALLKKNMKDLSPHEKWALINHLFWEFTSEIWSAFCFSCRRFDILLHGIAFLWSVVISEHSSILSTHLHRTSWPNYQRTNNKN
jgi:hypothetical protein